MREDAPDGAGALSAVRVRPVEPRDAAAWAELYRGYREFYVFEPDARVVETTFTWVLTGEHGMFGFVVVDEADTPIALANLRWFARPSTATVGLYLDDLFTSPAARGRGAASALLKRASALAAERGASTVRWITASDNSTARSVYDQHAVVTKFVTYDMVPSAQ